ncbi:hypothetical protein H4R33_001538 [Dimargaris cristalligena]|uniref:Uncharacterized protein n=1 Tax=Dimargaris cristalligena TaxID=215637 RepID=A0A4P9ZZL8_9FUNG|nr:hypothetical protein H4R33_001538 [Dimargaris cristalligena]RKP39193.1 hypothetical protein BJ085DRAFT_37972 [Dimargaris cristalligena]|eukprot:RKP39193.1 hypothetical protein BJ085DRAFT_37972 [Dimargaris cristalligena]
MANHANERLKPIILIPDGNVVYAKPKRTFISRVLPSGKWAGIALIAIFASLLVALIAQCLVMTGQLDQIDFTYWAQKNNQTEHFNNWRLIQNSTPIIVYNAIFIASLVYLLVSWWDTLVHKNIFQAGSLIIFSILTIVFAVIQYYHLPTLTGWELNYIEDNYTELSVKNTKAFEYVLLAFLAAGTLVIMALGVFLYREFAWSFYKKLGADVQIRRLNVNFLIMVTLFKLDAFFFEVFAIQVLTLWVADGPYYPWIRALLAFFFEMVILTAGYLGLIREQRPLMLIFLGGLVLGLGYILFELALVARGMSRDDPVYTYSSGYILFYVCVNVILIVLSFGYGLRCYHDFGQGLLEARSRASMIGDPNESQIITVRGSRNRRPRGEKEVVSDNSSPERFVQPIRMEID